MPRLDVLDEELGEDAAAVRRARRRRIIARLFMLAGVALGLGAIGALAFAWSNANGRLRLELQVVAPKNAQRAAAAEAEEIDRLRRQIEALQVDVKELTEAQHQAAHTIAAMKAAEQELRRQAPAPYWYSNPAALDPTIGKEAAALPPRRPQAGRSQPREQRQRDTAAPSPAAR
jgi:uncharacterized protein HemX